MTAVTEPPGTPRAAAAAPVAAEPPVWGTAARTDTVVNIIERAVDESGDSVFLDFSGVQLTYREVWDLALRRAGGLRALGVGPGDTVLCLLDNNSDAVVSWFAANALGAVWVPVNTALKADFLRHQASDSGAAVAIVEGDYAERFVDIEAGLPELTHLAYRGGTAPDGLTRVTALPLADVDAAGDAAPVGKPIPADYRDLSMLIYTSGTTGPSKGCMISHNYAANLAATSAAKRDRSHTLWTPLPLFHLNAAATSVLATAVNQSTLAIAPRFSVSNFWPEVERTGARRVSILGVMISLIASMPDTPEMVRCHGQIVQVGGAPWTPELIEIWQSRFGVQSAGSAVFGLTEATYITSTPTSMAPPLGCAGRRNNDFDVRIVDDEDNELPDGQPGEIILRPRRPHIMFEGYWRRPEATLAVTRNLWFHTGDVGRFDDDGWLWFVDRKKDYLRRRGENISSFELERTFRSHPDVTEVAVHAVPSEFTEDDIKVTAILVEGSALTEEQLCSWSLDKLPYFAVPRYIEFRRELPKNATGKVLKYQLRDEGVTPSTWVIDSSDLTIVKR
ncbi:AMP-binding protein [Gordonia sp. zg691]|uniref:AMP-binding protein n=1 Tax=Gordonia jinghuaiqii TaxID=2758710 RepID=UPI0016623062|nr:AMP-binding protein [Gordonia jinghuaiqii]MBD0862489.1 AMP-binding protein [Gordonia jinghuaiqii]